VDAQDILSSFESSEEFYFDIWQKVTTWMPNDLAMTRMLFHLVLEETN